MEQQNHTQGRALPFFFAFFWCGYLWLGRENVSASIKWYLHVFTIIWVFPKIGIPQNGWFTMENPITMDDVGVPLFLETPICIIFTIKIIYC